MPLTGTAFFEFVARATEASSFFFASHLVRKSAGLAAERERLAWLGAG